jgi:hypothetical protein
MSTPLERRFRHPIWMLSPKPAHSIPASLAPGHVPTLPRNWQSTGICLPQTPLFQEIVPMSHKLVILESPFAGDVEANIAYARRCVKDSLMRGEAPIASHLLYTQDGILDDTIPAERTLGIDAGLAWRRVAEGSVVYTDRGISPGMEYGIALAKEAGLSIEYRQIGDLLCDIDEPEAAVA